MSVAFVKEQESTLRQAKKQIVQEIEEMFKIRGMTRTALSVKTGVNPSSVTQTLSLDTGLQLSTLVRIANALDCDLEVNLIRRGQ